MRLSLLLAFITLTALQAQEPLPSGNGLAAKFPGDLGITANPAVIFADGFEKANFAAWDGDEVSKNDIFSFPAPGQAGLGAHCLKVDAHLGKDTGGGPTKWFRSAPTIYIRFYTKFDENCDYVHHFVTLRANKGLRGKEKWSGFGAAGLKPEGDERFSTALEPWGNWAKFPAPGRWNFYSYWYAMKPAPDKKYWGNQFAPKESPNIAKGQWICCEFMLKHNTPSEADGEQAFWIDGKLQGHYKGIPWRTSPTLFANALTVESYITENWTKNPLNTVYFDQVVIAKEYIGPVSPK